MKCSRRGCPNDRVEEHGLYCSAACFSKPSAGARVLDLSVPSEPVSTQPARPKSTRHYERLSMGLGAILSLAEAAAVLPIADYDARRWLRELGLVRNIDGRAVVVWLDVVEELRRGPPSAAPGAKQPPRRRLPRVRL